MPSHPFICGIDFCFNPTSPGVKSPEGHYELNYGFIQRAAETDPWTKVTGYVETMVKNNTFGFQIYDMSQTVQSVDFVTVAMRPAADSGQPSGQSSPFSESDDEKLREGQELLTTAVVNSRGCGDGNSEPAGNEFQIGQYLLKNIGNYEMTVELRIVYNGETMLFKCDPEMQIGDD